MTLLPALTTILINPITILLLLGILIFYRKFYILTAFLLGIIVPIIFLFIVSMNEDGASGLYLILLIPPSVLIFTILGYIIQIIRDKKRGITRGNKVIFFLPAVIVVLVLGFIGIRGIMENYEQEQYQQTIKEKKYEERDLFVEAFMDKAFAMGMKNDTYVLGFDSRIFVADYENQDGLFAEGTIYFKKRGNKTHTEEAFNQFKSEIIEEFNRMKSKAPYNRLELNDWQHNNIKIVLVK
jgi:hypothetical protein